MKNLKIFTLSKRYLSSKLKSVDRKKFDSVLDQLYSKGKAPDGEIVEKSKFRVYQKISLLREKEQRKKQLFLKSARYAASVVAISLSLFLCYYYLNKFVSSVPLYVSKVTEAGVRATITLSDGSVVRLNENSSLEFPKAFGSNKRMVKLQGEAYFEVVPDSTRPFHVMLEEAEVVVLGTTFNINTFRSPEITVATGKVKVADNLTKDQVIVTKGHQVVLEDGQMEVAEVNADFFIGWHTRKLKFDASPVGEFFRVLERAYGVAIVFETDSKEADCFITGYYEDERLETILKGLTHILDFTYTVDVPSQTITLKIIDCKN